MTNKSHNESNVSLIKNKVGKPVLTNLTNGLVSTDYTSWVYVSMYVILPKEVSHY